jgi:phosphinothricin acetyltransferase
VNHGADRALLATLVIRRARPADADRLAAIYGHHVLNGTATFETEPPPAVEMARRVDDVLSRGLPWSVAVSGDGRVVGFACAGPYRLRPAYRYTVEDSVYLDPAWTRMGIGRALLAGVIVACEVAGCRQMIAVIGDSANTASIALHRALGFVEAGAFRDVGWKFGRWLDTVLMQRQLGSAATNPPDAAGGMQSPHATT